MAGRCFWTRSGTCRWELQAKLLRLIQQGEIEKVGAPNASTVDVRIIAATHRNLQAMIEDGTFREDLYYRLSVIPLDLPPLRERAEDLPDLILHFFAKAKAKHGREQIAMPEDLIPYFNNYRWPGNIRELENILERVVVLTRSDEVGVNDLPEQLRRERPTVDTLNLEMPPRGISLEAVEKELILRSLRKFNWNQTHAARYLDVSRKALMYRMEKHGIQKPETAPADEEAPEQ